MQALRDPATVQKLILMLERQLATHSATQAPQDAPSEWSLKEANLQASLSMARLQLSLLTGHSEP